MYQNKKTQNAIKVSDLSQMRIAIVASQFHAEIVDRLVAGAKHVLKQHAIDEDHIKVDHVPGAYELPLAAKRMIQNGCHAVIALGVIIRGDTPHFDYVAGACANGLMRVALDSDTPVAFGVLTTDNIEQAVERAGGSVGNKGAEAAEVALTMLGFSRCLDKSLC